MQRTSSEREEWNHPAGLDHPLDGNLDKSGPDSGLLLERKFSLKPGEIRSPHFLIRIQDLGFRLGLANHQVSAERLDCSPRFQRTVEKKWPAFQYGERAMGRSAKSRGTITTLRSGFTYDDFFHQHIISQGQHLSVCYGVSGSGARSFAARLALHLQRS